MSGNAVSVSIAVGIDTELAELGKGEEVDDTVREAHRRIL